MRQSDQLESFFFHLLPLKANYFATKHIATPSPSDTAVFYGNKKKDREKTHDQYQIKIEMHQRIVPRRVTAASIATAQSFMT